MFYNMLMLHIKLTNKCDKDCQYCFDDKSTRGRVTFEDFKELVDKSSGFKKLFFIFMGGESLLLSPMLFEECFSYAKKVCEERHQKCEFKVITNGSKLNDVFIDLFKRYGVYLVVSYDGRGQHKSEIEQITKYKEYIDTVNFTLNQENHEILWETLEELNTLGIPHFDGYINIHSPEEYKDTYANAMVGAIAKYRTEKPRIKWLFAQDIVQYARFGKNAKRNAQMYGIMLNSDVSLRPGGRIMPTVLDNLHEDISIGNIYEVEHVIDLIFGEKNRKINKAYLKTLENLQTPLEKDLHGGYIFDKMATGHDWDSNWTFVSDIYQKIVDSVKDDPNV